MNLLPPEDPLPARPVPPALPAAEAGAGRQDLKELLIRLLARSYLRREGRFYHIDRPLESMSRDDLQRAFLIPARRLNNGDPVPKPVLKEVFDTAILQNNADPDRSIPVWTGAITPYPGNPRRRIQLESGQVILNGWKQPDYRRLPASAASLRPFLVFFSTIFQSAAERDRVLDWLAWSLQNEHKKPNWAILLYSQRKGTGKSTFCRIAAQLFGFENTSVENNIEKVAGKFNGPILGKKLIVCEELHLRPDSEVGNKLKTLITEPFTMAERKGRDVEKLPLHACFLMTTNHLPLWIEAGERRFYVVDVDHEGHASGPKAGRFGRLVKRVEAAMADPQRMADLYHFLLQRKPAEDFDALSLNIERHGTEVMKKLLAHQFAATTQQLAEYLGRENCIAITEQDLRAYVTQEMRVSVNAIRHMMTELGWSRHVVKWGGKDYARALWTAPKYTVDRGNILGPGAFRQAVCDALWDAAEA
ncbi:primase-helicase family protein [Neotabrizicola sp. VNH66]|uniref:primase-helicase family protein n=1 Tax=Neotabrizicola sp. VNH66 TaxID=3400918 RepID=UPI003C2FB1E7